MRYRIGEYELDPAGYRLTHDGQPIAVEPRVFELLGYLVEHRDRLVSKEELLAEVWQGRVVNEAVLARAVHAARRALAGSPDSADWIQNVHGRGYRFSGPAESIEASGSKAGTGARGPQPRRLAVAAGIALLVLLAVGLWFGRRRLALPADRGVALLPFVNATGNEGDDWVELGLMDLVATRLSRQHGLEVVPTSETLSALDNLGVDTGAGLAPEQLNRLRRGLGAPVVLSSVVARDVGLYRLQMTIHGGKLGTYSRSRTGSDLFVVAAELSDELSNRVIDNAGGAYGTSREGVRAALAVGVHELLSGRPAEARRHLERALDADPDLTEARYRLGIALRDLGLWPESSAAAMAVRTAAAAAGDAGMEARAERLLGDIAQLRGGYDEAEGHYRRALELLEATGDLRGRSAVWSSLATISLQRHDWPEARSRSAEALALCRRLDHLACVAQVEHTLGVLSGRGGELAEADVHFSRVLELAREIGDPRAQARALSNLGSNAQNRGDWDRAEQLHRQALRLRREQRDALGTAGSLVNLAVTGTWRGALTRADADASEALEVFQALGNPRGEAMAHTVRAYVAKGRGDWAGARESMERAQAIWRQLGVGSREALAVATLAEIADEAGDTETATRLSRRAHEAIVELGDRNLLAYTLRVRGRAAALAGEGAEAERLFREALAISREVGNEGIEGSIATDLADLLLEHGRAAEAAPLVALLRERLPESGPVALLAARLELAEGRRAAGCRLAESAQDLAHELWDEQGSAVLAGCKAGGVADG